MQVLKQEVGIDNLSSPGWTFPQGPFLKNEKKNCNICNTICTKPVQHNAISSKICTTHFILKCYSCFRSCQADILTKVENWGKKTNMKENTASIYLGFVNHWHLDCPWWPPPTLPALPMAQDDTSAHWGCQPLPLHGSAGPQLPVALSCSAMGP